MSFEPEKLFIGPRDFFSILLPGAVDQATHPQSQALLRAAEQKRLRLDGARPA